MTSDALAQLWQERYGVEPPAGIPLDPLFLSHKSVRSFLDKPLPEGWIEALIAAAQSASTSSHLQVWSVISVQDPARRQEISMLCGDQNQVRTCSLFLAFCGDHYRIRKAAEGRGEDPDALPFNEMYTMAVIDAALASERLVVAAESLGLGICYVGGLRNQPEGVAELLKMPKGVVGLFGLAIGFPTEKVTPEVKPRLAQHAVWFREEYCLEPDTVEFDERMRGFYESQGMKGEFTWSARSGKRLRKGSMSNRESFGDFVRRQGMDLE